MVFYLFFLIIKYFLNILINSYFSVSSKNKFLNFFEKNLNLKRKLYDFEQWNLKIDYRTEEEIKKARNTSPFLFKDIYRNYRFFIKGNRFNNSFNNFITFLNFNNKFIVFYFFYSFMYHRFFIVNKFSFKNNDFINKCFYEIIFLCFYFLKDVKFKNNLHYNNRLTYIFKNFKNIKNKEKLSTSVDVYVKSSRVAIYNNIFKKCIKLNNFFFKNKIGVFLKIFFEYNYIIILNDLNLKKNWKIIFYNNFLYKYICNTKINNYNIYFLRKNRMFNKGRYSRNRQNYRTGIYWCLYVNIVAIFTIYYFFYRFSFNFGYLWWLLAFGINCFFFNKFVKYKLYILQNFFNNIAAIYRFYLSIVVNFKFSFISIFRFFFLKKNKIFINLISHNNFFKKINFYFLNFYYFIFTFIRKIV